MTFQAGELVLFCPKDPTRYMARPGALAQILSVPDSHSVVVHWLDGPEIYGTGLQSHIRQEDGQYYRDDFRPTLPSGPITPAQIEEFLNDSRTAH